jgi:alpha-L-rhamnosidase
MIHDFFMLQQDEAFVRSLLPGVQYTLSWFLERLAPNGLLGPLPFWNHTDGGAAGFPAGSPPGSEQGGSVQISLMFAIALDQTAQMLEHLGDEEMAKRYADVSSAIKAAVRQLAWDETRQWFAETPDKRMFSQHTNALAMLAGMVDESEQSAFATRLVHDKQLVQGTLYFQFYVFEALQAAGRADLILPELDRWTQMLGYGLSTFPEHGVESRSDVHAWAAHPLYHLLASTGGIRPATPGFRHVDLRPAPGGLSVLVAKAVHPHGTIQLEMVKDVSAGVWKSRILLPESVEGTLHWKGATYPMKLVTTIDLPLD